jgi:hypothetical protein
VSTLSARAIGLDINNCIIVIIIISVISIVITTHRRPIVSSYARK